jgi:molecular chaperone DnaK
MGDKHMNRMTVDFGIDLGTTNSAIALLKGIDVEIIKNNEGQEYTPSAVFIDKNNALIVGSRAKERLESDPKNAFAEFKLQMGTDAEYVFSRNGRKMKPEDLSAEVLKSLKADVRQHLGEDVGAAVITVPAAFELPQCDATNKAAQLAGINFSLLVTEPAAAAFAYGFQNENRNAFWLVYDFGGGTFDAAVIKVRDGIIQVVNHEGDNHLGGKLIDWAIVEKLLIPALTREHRLADFRRGNPKCQKAIAKLKHAAEQAKIAVSRLESTEISIDALCQDDEGESIDFEYDLKKSDVERIAQPFVLRTINICRQVLADRRLNIGDIERILLVGGPTLTPYLREFLADSKEGLGIPLEFSLDPLTVVARGAARFAGTQRDESAFAQPASAGQFVVELLNYKPVGNDNEPFIGGRVLGGDGEDTSDFTIEFVNVEARTQWRSGKIPLSPNGSFSVMLWAEEGGTNTYNIELQDATGAVLKTAPSSIPYTIGIATENPPLIHSVGLGLANNEVRVFFEKGTELPARKRFIQKLAYRVRKGVAEEAIRLPIIEGEHKKADRNKLIGYLEIPATEIKRDLPAGAEIEITIEIDQSRLVRAEAYITMLNAEFEKVLTMKKTIPDSTELREEVEREKKRLEEAREKLYMVGDTKATPILERIQDERIFEDVENSLDAAAVDRDAADKAQNRLLELKATVDELEDALEIPTLLAEAQQIIEWTQEIVDKWGKPEDQPKFRMLLGELKATMEARVLNPSDLRRRTDNLDDLRMRILRSKDEWWLDYLAHLEEYGGDMTNQVLAEQLFTQARRSIGNNDIDGVKSACQQLVQLLPARQQQSVGRFRSSVA